MVTAMHSDILTIQNVAQECKGYCGGGSGIAIHCEISYHQHTQSSNPKQIKNIVQYTNI
jgi:hypothetical protein